MQDRTVKLRRQLAAKSRFYGQPDWAGLWLGERGEGEGWQRRINEALRRARVG